MKDLIDLTELITNMFAKKKQDNVILMYSFHTISRDVSPLYYWRT